MIRGRTVLDSVKNIRNPGSKVNRYDQTYQSNTLTNPRAMMIKLLNTVITNRAMRSTWWTIEQASITKLHFHCMAIDYHILHSR
jgi:hypothetical protein